MVKHINCIRSCGTQRSLGAFKLEPGESLILEIGHQLTESLINPQPPEKTGYPPFLFNLLNSRTSSTLRSWEHLSYLEMIPLAEPSPENFMKLLEVKPQLDLVRTYCKEIEEFFTESGHGAYAPELVFNEFLVNIIKHGLSNNTEENIFILVLRRHGKNILIFLDKGIAWTLPPREGKSDSSDADNSVAEIPEGGRGLEIIYHLSGDFSRKRIMDINKTVFHIK